MAMALENVPVESSRDSSLVNFQSESRLTLIVMEVDSAHGMPTLIQEFANVA